jgi:hypothetical protein
MAHFTPETAPSTSVRCFMADMAATKPTSVVLTRSHRDAMSEEIESAFQ